MDTTTLFTIIGAIVIPCLSGFGSWVAVKVALAVLKVKVDTVVETVDKHDVRIDRLNDDALIHDMELESALLKLDIPRVRRQRVRD